MTCTDRRGRLRTWAVLAGLFAPAVARADGGAPMLLFAGPVTFLVGQVWIIVAEMIVLRAMVGGLRWGEALRDVVAANLKSLLLVGVVLPTVVSVAGWLLAIVLGVGFHAAGMERASALLATWSFVLTGWAFNSELVRAMFPYQFVLWFVVSYGLSVVVEGKVLAGRWEARGAATGVNVTRASAVMNATSYAGLAAVLAGVAMRYLRG